ncbi:cardiolipin synthase [Paenibacillus sp. UMB4589-SE434]|uniref:cardiolipin synthase n=1 Tax=Paenibacillus sp. UMB4589-SE434 TaxID=3046314 RepID=UPI002551BDD6|nr:cardiolipin synthase [Paenibacillus sp. UMB4589-SE434]MDK8183594.1 cardiolipin synthase [Paenibacillus sp. UMB4589-SE434]
MKNKFARFLLGTAIAIALTLLLNSTVGSLYTVLKWSVYGIMATIVVVVLMENRSPQTTLSWLFVLFSYPTLGIILYLLFGRNSRKRKHVQTYINIAKQARLDAGVDTEVKKAASLIHMDHIGTQTPEKPELVSHSEVVADRIRLIGGDNCVGGSSADLLTNGDETFNAIRTAIAEAAHHIHVQYYIYRSDRLGTELRDLLIEKAKQGVQVRFMYDGLGSHALRDRFLVPMKEAGIKVAAFDPIFAYSLTQSANYRNHRKIVVVDGQVAFTGGLNVGDEYMGQSKMGFWRDSHLRIEGYAVHDLHRIFLQDWIYAASRTYKETWKQFMHNEDYFPNHLADYKGSKGGIQIIPGGPNYKDAKMRDVFLSLMAGAKESIWITTPYFVPDQETLTFLQLAASSGIDVRILYPGKSDSLLSDQASQSYFAVLLAHGVQIYRYKENFTHAKMMLIDGKISSVGTANMDIRSFRLNYEVTAILYDMPVIDDILYSFYEDFKCSTPINPREFVHRKVSKRIVESLTRLLSPLL